MQQARGLAIPRQPLTTTPLHHTHLPSFVGPEGAHIPHSSGMFTSPDHLLDSFSPEESEEAPSLFEQASAPIEQPRTPPQPALKSGIIRRNSGNNSLKRIQVRSNNNENKIVKSKRSRTSIVTRGISSTMRKVRNKITELSGDGVDDELIEHMHGHIQEEVPQEVPQSFSSLTESQEVTPIQQSGRHGLRRFD